MKWFLLFLGVFMLGLPKVMAEVQYSGFLSFKISNIEDFIFEDRVQIFDFLRNRPEFNSGASDIQNSIYVARNKSIAEIKNDSLLTMIFEFRNLENLNLIENYLFRITRAHNIKVVIIREFKYRGYECKRCGGVNPWPWTSVGN
jgi:hypothetical protein